MRKRIALLVTALVFALALAGCAAPKPPAAEQLAQSGGPASMVGQAKDNAAEVTCRTNRAQIDQLYSAAQSAGSGSTDFAAVLAQSRATCPSGGAYSWDAATSKTRCSVHGE
jgi:hypothetical protein